MPENELHNERDLLAQIAQGDEVAFTTLFQHYHNRVGAFVMQLTGNRQYAEEITQDVFLKIWLKRSSLTQIDHFNAYLYATSRNFTISFLRKLGREMLRQKDWEQTVIINQVENEPPDTYYRELMEKAISLLPAQQQKVYLLSRDQGLKQADIAKELSISLETVKKHMVLALRSIKEYMLKNGDAIIFVILTSYLRD